MNKVSKYLIIILLLLNKNIFAQDQFKIFGSVYDSLENKVAYATVLLLHSNNSQLAAYAITNSEGYFHLITSKSGLYQLQITFIGYGDYIEEVELNDKKTEVNLGKITLKEQAFLLKEAKVESEILPIIIKGDTTEYDASSFSTGVNTNLADLLNQMPGIDVDRHGNITAQGKKIEKLLVENEEFFGNTHGLVTNNISAEIIDKVQVFDDKSEFTKHTGIDDGNKEATLNLKLKQGKYKGYFGDADIAGGMPNKRYKATGNINRFDKKKQISLLGTSNNINQQVINMYDYLTFTGSVDDAMTNSLDFSEIPINLFSNIGVSNNSLLGANLNYKFKESTKLHLNYMFVNSKNITEYQRTSECFLSSNTYEQYSLNTIDNKINNHIAKADFKSKIGENQNIRIKAFISSNEFENTDQDNTEMILLDSSVYRKTQARKTLESDKLNFNLAADYYLKLNKEGRSIGVELYGKNTLHNKFEHFLNSLNLSNQNNLEKINQSTKFDQKHSIYSFNLFYTEALKNNNYLIFTVERYYNFSEACKTSQNTIDADNQLVIDSLSGSFNNDYNYTYFKLQHRKLALKYNYSSSVRFQHYEHKNTQLTNSYNYIFPEFTFQYNINRTKKTQFEYKTFANMPNLLQSISILDNSNYNYLFIGNPYLVPEYVNYINFNYSTYGVLSQKYFYVGFNSSFKTKQIINSTFVDEDLQTIIKPKNAGNSFFHDAFYFYETPISKTSIRIISELHLGFGQYHLSVNNIDDKVLTYNISQKLELRNRKKKTVNTGLGARGQYTVNSYNIFSNHEYYSIDVFADLNIKFAKQWDINIDFTQEFFPKIRNQLSESYSFLNFSVGKLFFKDKLYSYFKLINAFDESINLTQSISANQYYTSLNNRLGRVFLLGIKYNLRQLDKN